MRFVESLFLAALVFAPAAVHAQLNKCTGADGKVTYQSEPCPTTSKSQAVRPPTAPSSGGFEPGEKGKDGWDPEVLSRMYSGCVSGAMRDWQASWEREARADPKLGPFPQAEFRASGDAFCRCLTQRVRTSVKPGVDLQQLAGTMMQYTGEALKGGQCRPTGIVARILAGG